MCYRTQLNTRIKTIENTFDAHFTEPEAYTPKEEINGFEFPHTPVITNENPGGIELFQWGLVPFWAKDPGIRKGTLNARIETAVDKPAFRNSIENRCLVLASGFYEWQWLDPKGKQKQKYYIRPRGQEVFAFAGIYSHWRPLPNGQLLPSYSILTTQANEIMNRIHNTKQRMPVVLRKEDQQKWLSGSPIEGFSWPYQVDLEALPV